MDCRSTILVNNRFLFLMIHTKGDYNYKRQISPGEWLGLWRYEISPMYKQRPLFTINSGAKTGIKISNFIYRTKHKVMCFFGKHDGSIYDDKCYHCKQVRKGT